MNLRYVVAIFALTLFANPALAQKVPEPGQQESLIKQSLMTFNDANLTGNYEVLHARLSAPFRNQITPEKLKDAFKSFADGRINLGLVLAKKPVAVGDAKVDDEGKLLLRGYFDTTPNRVNYDLGFVRSEGEWKLIKLNVNLKKPD